MREATMSEFSRAHAAGAVVIDVSEAEEYERGHIPGAVLIPLRDLADRRCEIDKRAPVYVVCSGGNRSLIATGMLMRGGYSAYSVIGGTAGWVRAGQALSGGTPVRG